MNPQKNYRRYRVSVSIHGLDSSICRSTHSLACSYMMHSMLIMKFGCIHARNFFLAMYKRNNVSFKISLCNRLDRVLGFLSNRRYWLLPPPHPQASVAPPLVPGGHTRLRERRRGEPIRTKVKTLWYFRYSIIPLRFILSNFNQCSREIITHFSVYVKVGR